MLEMHLICILKKYLELQPDVHNIVIEEKNLFTC